MSSDLYNNNNQYRQVF